MNGDPRGSKKQKKSPVTLTAYTEVSQTRPLIRITPKQTWWTHHTTPAKGSDRLQHSEHPATSLYVFRVDWKRQAFHQRLIQHHNPTYFRELQKDTRSQMTMITIHHTQRATGSSPGSCSIVWHVLGLVNTDRKPKSLFNSSPGNREEMVMVTFSFHQI